MLPLQNFLADCNVTVIITHGHFDHHSLLSEISSLSTTQKLNSEGEMENVPVFTISQVLYNNYGKSSNIDFSDIPENLVKRVISIDNANQIDLGSGANLSFVLPYTWPQKKIRAGGLKRSDDPNDNSLTFTLTCGLQKILFTGDATGATLNAVQRVPENIEKLKNVTCIVVPHHGSNLNGAYTWFYFIKDNVDAEFMIPLLAFVSSDPTEADHLPWHGVSEFVCWRNGNRVSIPWHEILTADDHGDETTLTDQPIFLSANALAGYWTAVLTDGSEFYGISVFDGDPQEDGNLFRKNDDNATCAVEEKNNKFDEVMNVWNQNKENVLEILNILKYFNSLDSDRKQVFLNLFPDYLTAINANQYEPNILIESVRHFDLLFSTVDAKDKFLRYLLGRLTSIPADTIGYPELLSACLDHYEIFPVESFQNMFIEKVNQYLKVAAHSTEYSSVLEKCIGKPEIINGTFFAEALGEFLSIPNDMYYDLLFRCIENIGMFNEEGRIAFCKLMFEHLENFKQSDVLTFENWQNFVISITKNILPYEIDGSKEYLQKIVELMPSTQQ